MNREAFAALHNKLHREATDNTLVQFYRYTFIGGAAFVVDFGLLFVLTHYAGLHYILSASISFMAGSVLNYFISVKWIFNTRPIQNKMLEFWLFVGIGLTGLGLNALIIYVFTTFIGVYYLVSKLISAALIYTWNFGVRKVLLFGKIEEIA